MPGTLTHSPADVIRRLLIQLGHGTTPEDSGEWPIYVATEPDSPDNAITLYDTAGINQGDHMIDGERQEKHGFQVRIRGWDHTTGYTKAREIAVGMDQNVDRTSATVPDSTGAGVSYTVWSITRSSDVLSLGRDTPQSKRHIFTINAVTSLREQS